MSSPGHRGISSLPQNGTPSCLFDFNSHLWALITHVFSAFASVSSKTSIMKWWKSLNEVLNTATCDLNVMTFISQATCVVLLQRWRVKMSVSFTPALINGRRKGDCQAVITISVPLLLSWPSLSLQPQLWLCMSTGVEICVWTLRVCVCVCVLQTASFTSPMFCVLVNFF